MDLKSDWITSLPIATIIIRINAPGAVHFLKGEVTITDTKNQLSSPVAMRENGHLQP